jgi:hypothetical protein
MVIALYGKAFDNYDLNPDVGGCPSGFFILIQS